MRSRRLGLHIDHPHEFVPALHEGVGALLLQVGAAGLGLFAIGFGHRLEPAEAAKLRQSLLGTIAAGLLLSVVALTLRVLVLTAGASIFNADVWAAVMRSRIGDAFWLRVAGLVLLTAAATGLGQPRSTSRAGICWCPRRLSRR